jgi:hypothetical protein
MLLLVYTLSSQLSTLLTGFYGANFRGSQAALRQPARHGLRHPDLPGDPLHQPPPGFRRIRPVDVPGDSRVRLGVAGKIAIRVEADVGVEQRVEGYGGGVDGGVHLLAACRLGADGVDPLAQELEVGHAVCAGSMHGLGGFEGRERAKEQGAGDDQHSRGADEK